MKKIWVAMGLMMTIWAGPASAWKPAGWVFMAYPWAYEPASGDWVWFNPNPQWVHGYAPANGWRTLNESGMGNGWVYFEYPFAFAQSNGAWHWINETDAQWIHNMSTLTWSRLGEPVHRGMVRIPGRTNEGTWPGFGAYSIRVETFYLDRFEVTKALWDEVVAWAVTHGGYEFDNPGGGKGPDHPVHSISWYDAVKWCNARSEMTGREPVYYLSTGLPHVFKRGQEAEPYVHAWADGYRLPTVDEWRYAAMGGLTDSRFPWGNTIDHTQANYTGNSTIAYDLSGVDGCHPAYHQGLEPFTSPVGSFPPNGFGLYDMAGNVEELTFSRLTHDVTIYRRIVGGSWLFEAEACQVGAGGSIRSETVYRDIGFRTMISGE